MKKTYKKGRATEVAPLPGHDAAIVQTRTKWCNMDAAVLNKANHKPIGANLYYLVQHYMF